MEISLLNNTVMENKNIEKNNINCDNNNTIEDMNNSLNINDLPKGNIHEAYFIIKSINRDNLLISTKDKIWATSKSNINKYVDVLSQSESVYLIFSINESGGVQGFGKLLEITDDSSEGKFIDIKNYC